MKNKIIYGILLTTTLLSGCSSSDKVETMIDQNDSIIETKQKEPVLSHTCVGEQDNIAQIWRTYETSDGKVAKVVVAVTNGTTLTNSQFNESKEHFKEDMGLSDNQISHEIEDGMSFIVVQYNTFDELNNLFENKLISDDGNYVFGVIKEDPVITACDGVATNNTPMESNESQSDSSVPASGIRPEFKEMMDNYVVFYQQYADFMNNADPNSADYYTKYFEMLNQYTQTMAALDKMEDMEMNNEEMQYYLEKMGEIQQILSTVQFNEQS